MKILGLGIKVLLVPFLLVGCGTKEKLAQEFKTTTFKTQEYVTFRKEKGTFILSSDSKTTHLVVDSADYPGVLKVTRLFRDDIEKVTDRKTEVVFQDFDETHSVVFIGTLGHNKYIDKLVENGKIKTHDLKGKWETSLIQVVENPFPGISEALVIAGSDKRGTIYGMFDVSAQIGVSPWYWWADIPVQKHTNIFIKNGRYNLGEPKVQYRGIFINDEEPALGNWARETFGGINSQFYEKVFELILRMKGNFLWPAMWGKAFAADDTLSPVLANQYGIVINYSHHEPMMRSHKEWGKEHGEWNYETNKENLQKFWREGIERNLGNESIVTIGMRGDGDEPMSRERNIEVLSTIIKDQRSIIEEVTGKPAGETPQVWALYKEVQEYYDSGMRVPDDIILLYCDDNWGNIRRVPGDEERQHPGGTGLYYHFDYVGGPRSYKWMNTNALPKIWHQNKVAYEFGINKLWVVNVGDIKPMELPIQFYLDLAWDPDRFDSEKVNGYLLMWSAQQFGKGQAKEIALLLERYSQYSSRRKPELLNENSYSLVNYNEFENVVKDYRQLVADATSVFKKIPEEYKDAYYQLVQYPIEATANLYDLYFAVAMNKSYFKQKKSLTNLLADSVKYYFEKDSLLTDHYHRLSQGKWNHMMSQAKIGAISWKSPSKEIIPVIDRIEIPSEALPCIYVEGNNEEIKDSDSTQLHFDNLNSGSHYFEIFNQGHSSFNYSIQSENNCVCIDNELEGEIIDQKRFKVSINWDKVSEGHSISKISVTANNIEFTVVLTLDKFSNDSMNKMRGYLESEGYVSIDASDYNNSNRTDKLEWITIPEIGRTSDGITLYPFMFEEIAVDFAPFVEYDVYFQSSDSAEVYLYFATTNNFLENKEFKYAISFNDQSPKVSSVGDISKRRWDKMVSDYVLVTKDEFEWVEAGNNILKFKMLSPGLVLEKIIIDRGGLKKTYLGAPESFNTNNTL